MNRETVNMVRSPISVEGNIRLVPYYPAYDTALAWYQDAQLCKQVDNRDFIYDLPLLKRMYHYLDTHGELLYIEYRGAGSGKGFGGVLRAHLFFQYPVAENV